MTICKHINNAVKDSRSHLWNGVSTIRRRRLCTTCDARWTTIEIDVEELTKISDSKIKKNIIWALIKAEESAQLLKDCVREISRKALESEAC